MSRLPLHLEKEKGPFPGDARDPVPLRLEGGDDVPQRLLPQADPEDLRRTDPVEPHLDLHERHGADVPRDVDERRRHGRPTRSSRRDSSAEKPVLAIVSPNRSPGFPWARKKSRRAPTAATACSAVERIP